MRLLFIDAGVCQMSKWYRYSFKYKDVYGREHINGEECLSEDIPDALDTLQLLYHDGFEVIKIERVYPSPPSI